MPKTPCSAKLKRDSYVSSTTQYPSTADTTPPKIAPQQNITFFGKDFMDSLLNFMQHSHSFLQNWREETGLNQYMMSNEERHVRLQELMTLIAVKERELAELEAQRAALSATPDESYSNYSRGVEGYSSSQRKGLQQQSHQYPVNDYQEEWNVIGNAVDTVDTQYSNSDEYSAYAPQQYSPQRSSSGRRPRTPQYDTPPAYIDSEDCESAEIVDDRYYNQTATN